MKVFENVILPVTVTCNDRYPPCMKKQIKAISKEKNKLLKNIS